MSAPRKPIYLSETIEWLSLDDLKRFAELLEIALKQSSKARLIRDIPGVLQVGIPEDLIQRLSSYPCDDLIVILALEEYSELLGPFIRKNALLTLPDITPKRHPLLVDIEGNSDFRIFAEFIPTARRLCEKLSRLESKKAPDRIAVLPPESLINDIYTLWAALSKRPIKLTKRDVLKKRDIDFLTSLLLVDNDEPALADVQTYFGESRFETLLKFLQKSQGLRANGKNLEANPAFFGGNASDLPEIGRILVEMATGQSNAAGVALILFLLNENDGWIDIGDLDFVINKTLPRSVTCDTGSTLFTLFTAGYVAFGRKERRMRVYREREFLPLPADDFWAAEPDIIVGSNFEVKVPANTDPVQRVKIEAFADLRKPDLFYDYEITKASVYRALDDGISADDIIDVLRSYSKRPVPQNVEFAISNWERQLGSVGFEKGLFLVAGDRATAEELASLSENIGGEGEVIEFFGVRLDEGEYPRVRDYLRQMGFLPRSLPRSVQPRGGEGDVSVLFRGYSPEPKTPLVVGMATRAVLKRSIEFARMKGGRIKLELRDGNAVYGEPISIKRTRGETVVKVDCGGETVEVKLSDVVDFTLD